MFGSMYSSAAKTNSHILAGAMIIMIIEATEDFARLPRSDRDKWHFCDSNIDKVMNFCCYH